MIIALVYKTGGVYTPEYVERIVKSTDHEVVCLTDNPSPIQDLCTTIRLRHRWHGWWSKIELFTPGLWSDEKVMYVDLDTLIMSRDLTHIHQDKFTMLRDFFQPSRPASGVMCWTGSNIPEKVYKMFIKDNIRQMVIHRRGGDGAFIAKHVTPQNFFGDTVQSAKVEADRNSADIICFHGNPRPHTVNWDYTQVPMRRKPI